MREVASHVSGGATGTRERCAGKVVPQRHPADHVPAAERERVGWGLHGLHEGRTTLGCFVQFDAKGRKKERKQTTQGRDDSTWHGEDLQFSFSRDPTYYPGMWSDTSKVKGRGRGEVLFRETLDRQAPGTGQPD